LRFQRRELGEGRIRIRRLVALTPIEALGMRPIVRPVAVALRTIVTLIATVPLATMALISGVPIASLTAAVPRMAAFACRCTLGRFGARRRRRSIGRDGRRRRSVAAWHWRRCTAVPVRLAAVPRTPSRTFGTHGTARHPDFDHDRLGRLCRRRGRFAHPGFAGVSRYRKCFGDGLGGCLNPSRALNSDWLGIGRLRCAGEGRRFRRRSVDDLGGGELF
jgi:hypothetical protein